MHSFTQSDWAEGLHLTVTGLDKDQRRQVRHVVEAAGGRYSPNFSKRCTHLIVSAEQNDATQLKVYLASINWDKWHARAVRFEWLMECATQHRQVAEDAFAVQPPRHEDVSLIQRRLQEVATPTVSLTHVGDSSSGESTFGASKRCVMDTEVHSNITTRSAPKQASKRHKHADSQIQQQAVGVDKPKEVPANSMPTSSAASLCQTAPQAKPVLAAPSTRVSQQSACFKWSRLLPNAPCTTVEAGGDSDHMMQSHMQTHNLGAKKASTDMSSSGISSAQRQKTSVSALHHTSNTSSSTSDIGTHGAETSKLAGRLHAMRADAMDRACQKQQSQRVVPAATAPSLAHHSTTAAAAAVAAAAAPKLSQGPRTCELGPVTVNVDAHAIGHWDVAGQHHASGSQQAVTHTSRPAITASTAAVKPVNPCLASSSAQPIAKSRAAGKPALAPKANSDAQTNKVWEHHGHDLSTDTKSLVAKLRALSQGRTGNSQSRASSKLSGQQQQRNPIASRATNSSQPKPNTADPIAAPPAKRPRQAGMLSADAAAASYAAAWEVAAPGPSQPRPDTARCIQLLEPVHSGTEYESSTNPQHRSHRLHPHPASPAATNRLRPGYASVAAPIQLSAPTAQPLTAALPSFLPAHTAASAAAPAAAPATAGLRTAHHQQAPACPVQHRLGKPTPLKKGFTPKPSRFRLEAERLSLTPPDKSSGLEKVLFRSPVKAAAALSTGCSDDAAVDCNAAAARAPEAGPMVLQEADQLQVATGTGPGGSDPCSEQVVEAVCKQAMVTPANVGDQGMQADVPCLQGVFAHMRVILDPEMSPEESHRMSEAVSAGGGQIMAGSYLGTGASHVVCHPQTAVKWLAMGLSIVSPSWLLRSLARGTPDRCLHMSLDASRHLPMSVRAASPASAEQPAWSGGCLLHGANLPQDLSDRQARQSFVQHMQDQEALQHWGSAQQALQTPQTMLEEVVWCVSDPPQQARLDNLHAAAPFADVQSASINIDAVDVEMAESSPQLSATQEACQAELQEIESMCGTSDGAEEASLVQQVGRHLQEEDWREVLYKAPALTLLMPLDSLGVCGHGSRSLPVPPHGCTRQQLLHSIYNFYQEQLGVSEQLQLMKGSVGAASVVKEVFVEGMPVKRLSLLHSKVNVEGLERVSRVLTGTIYELKLSC